MDTKVKGIVVKLNDYKDADKIASIFTLEQGLISAKFNGVKKEKAKLKSVAQPFVFADFTYAEKGGNKTITSADIVDNFYNILSDYNKTIMGYIVLDVIKSILPKEKPEPDLFVLTVNALKNIELNNEYVETIKFLLKFISFSGMEIQMPESDYVFLDTLTGNFSQSKEIGFTQIDKKVYSTLKAINQEKDVEINETILKQNLRLLHNIIYLKFNEDIKSFQFVWFFYKYCL